MSKEYDGRQMPIIIFVPCDAKKLKMTAKVKGEELRMVMDKDAIKEARNDYLELDPEEELYATYVITDEGREYVESLSKTERNCANDK